MAAIEAERTPERETNDLFWETCDHIFAELSAYEGNPNIEMLKDRSGITAIIVRMQNVVLEIEKKLVRERVGAQLDDKRKMLLSVSPKNRKLHDWFWRRVREKLGNPMLDLAFSFKDLQECSVQGIVNSNTDIPRVSLQERGMHSQKFPREIFQLERDPELKEKYLQLAKVVLEVIREFWDEHGKKLLSGKTADTEVVDAAANTGATARDVVDR